MWLLIALGALLLLLSYPPFRLAVVSFIAIAPAVLLVRQAILEADPRRAFRWGFWYGVASQGLVLYWLVVALWHFTPLSALGYSATILALGLFHAALFWFVVQVRLRLSRVPLALVLPVSWTTLEWIIGHLGDVRFPWLGLGTSLADASLLVQGADVVGARGLTLWVAWCNVAIVEAVALGKGMWGRGGVTLRLVPVVATLLLALGYSLWRIETLPVRDVGVVALVQPNEGFREKWDAAHADSVMESLFELSARGRALARPDLIVWPEAAVPDYLVRRPEWEARIGEVAREGHTPILTGGLHATVGPAGEIQTFNAAFFFDSTGAWRPYPVYGKHYLVPVVERVPFVPVRWFRSVPWFRRWSGGFARGAELPLYPAGIGRFGVIVCYESAFEDLPRRYRMLGAEFLVNVTNDVWYGRTAGPYQHISHLVLRAVETRMGVARAANSGISALIDPLGGIHDATTLETRTVVAGRLQTSDVITLYARWGDWVGALVVLATLGFAGVLAWQVWGRRV